MTNKSSFQASIDNQGITVCALAYNLYLAG